MERGPLKLFGMLNIMKDVSSLFNGWNFIAAVEEKRGK